MNRKFLASAMILATLGAAAYTRNFFNGSYLRWPSGTRINVKFNNGFAPSNPSALVRAAVMNAFNSWNTALQTNGIDVRFVDAGDTSSNAVGVCDQQNVVSFTATLDPPLPSGVLAVAITSPAPVAGPVSCGGVLTADFPGQIIDADMAFNNRLQFSTVNLERTDGQPTNDIEVIALHEAGHMLGLHHSGIGAAIMNPAAESSGGFNLRRLTRDDIAGLNAVYGVNAPGGEIRGRVQLNSGTAVLGAQVVAVDGATGMATAATLSGSDGTYSLVGLPAPGSYRLYVHPLGGTVDPDNFPQELFQNANTNFRTTFKSSATAIVRGQPITGIDFSVDSPATTNLQSVAVVAGLSGTAAAVTSVRRGISAQICLGGTGLSGDLTLSIPTAKAVASGGTGGCAFAGFVGRTFQLAADIPPGLYDVYLPAAALPGALPVTVNPSVPSNGVVDAAAATQVFARGSIISIYGTDLAAALTGNDKLPVPTQLGDISVKIGDRIAPIYFASPFQINTMIPYELTGNSAEVKVLAGNNSESSGVRINLVSAAPRIFSLSQDGRGQGAIQIANSNPPTFAAPSGSIPGVAARPIRRGEFLTIYCQGLGDVDNRPPTGVAALGNPLSRTLQSVTVTIGGQTVPADFAGLSPGFVGLYQVNVAIPAGAPSGIVSLTISAGGVTSNTVTIAVE